MTKNSIDRWDFGTIFCLPAKGQTAAASVAATWRDTSVVSMAAMSMANFATVSAATAIRPTIAGEICLAARGHEREVVNARR
jgi:hypothetical protein